MSKPWGGIGAWAADAERAEDEERERQAAAAATTQLLGATESQSFPSLKEATAKPKKKKTMTLSEFTTGTHVGPGGGRRDLLMDSKGLTQDEMIRLPTGPKQRSSEEMNYGRLGGGFNRSFGRDGPLPPGGMRGRADAGDGSWGGGRRPYGGFDDERRAPPPPRVSQFDQPSRADEVDNWAMSKKPVPSMDSRQHDPHRSLGTGSGGGSRADEIDNWTIGKRTLPARPKNFGSGFRGSFSLESDRWNRGAPTYGDHERPRLVLEPPQGGGSSNEPAKMTKPSPFGSARPREEVLAEKGFDWRKMDSEIETRKISRPTSSHSSRPSSAHSSLHESLVTQVLEGERKARPKVNPFGDAKPREVLLQEKGKDWRKIDLELEHRGIDRPETEEEKFMKEEIDNLKKKLEKEAAVNANGESMQGSGREQSTLHEQILQKERDLELLICELDDKIRFGQRSKDRPGSGSGSGSGRLGFYERQLSQKGVPEDSGILEFMDRPQSRGTGGVWNRPRDDRRAFMGSRERGFLSNRDMDRSRFRERW